MIRTMLVHDSELLRKGIARLLSDCGEVAVRFAGPAGESLFRLIRNRGIDVVILDVNLDYLGVLEVVRRLLRAQPDTGIVVIGGPIRGPVPSKVLELGVLGYVARCSSDGDLLKAIKNAARGQPSVCPSVAKQLVLERIKPKGDPINTLSPRELSVMLMYGQGHDRHFISKTLNLSPKTVSTYRSRIMHKLGTANEVELAYLCFQHGLIEMPIRC